ncbi:MAG: J domain-containing protein [Nitrospinota bacterium]|nr:MAG: J domain-containing protein [Nitrospinota bacterium]
MRKRGTYFLPDGVRWIDELELEQYRTKPYFSLFHLNLSWWFWVVCQDEVPLYYGYEKSKALAEAQGRRKAGACLPEERPQYVRRKVPVMPGCALELGWCYLYYPLSREEIALVTQTRPQATARAMYRLITRQQRTRNGQDRRRDHHSDSPPSVYRSDLSCFALLGIATTSTVAEIKRAYHRKCLHTHPDQGGSHEAFIQLQQAYREALHIAQGPATPSSPV